MKFKNILKTLISCSLISSPILITACNKQATKMTPHIEKTNEKEKKWQLFLQYEYIDSLLKIVFGDNADQKAKYINEQKAIDDKYFSEIKEYLMYANNVTAFQRSEDFGKVLPLSKFRPKLDELFKQNWLWFLFNLDRFTFAYYETFDQFKADLEIHSLDIQKNSLDLGAFHRPKTNQALQHVMFENINEQNKEINFFILTGEGAILEIKLQKSMSNKESNSTENNEQKINVEIFTYSHIYTKLFKNTEELEKFDLSKYVSALEMYRNVSGGRTPKILFDNEYGGEPLRFTIVDVDNVQNKKLEK